MLSFGGYNLFANPIFFAGWFILPLACLIDWRGFVALATPRHRAWAIFLALMLVATQGPEQLGPLRWPFRYLPYFQISAVMLTLTALSCAGYVWRPRLLLAILGLQTVLSLQTDPRAAGPILIFALIVAASSFALKKLLPRPKSAAALLAFVGLAYFASTRWDLPVNLAVADWNFRRTPQKLAPLSAIAPASTFYLNGTGNLSDPGRFDELVLGQSALIVGPPAINGYSPIGHRGLAARFCMNGYGLPCPEAGPRLLERDVETGLSLADLMRVDRIVVERGPFLDRFNQVDRGPWRIAEERPRTIIFSRLAPNADLPGTLAWPVLGAKISALGEAKATREGLQIESRDPGVNRLIFARPYWAGYRVLFNRKPLAVHAYANMLVAVDLPADGSTGELELIYAPKYFGETIIVAALALIALIGATLTLGDTRKERQQSALQA
jgi:hypothetical protein